MHRDSTLINAERRAKKLSKIGARLRIGLPSLVAAALLLLPLIKSRPKIYKLAKNYVKHASEIMSMRLSA